MRRELFQPCWACVIILIVSSNVGIALCAKVAAAVSSSRAQPTGISPAKPRSWQHPCQCTSGQSGLFASAGLIHVGGHALCVLENGWNGVVGAESLVRQGRGKGRMQSLFAKQPLG